MLIKMKKLCLAGVVFLISLMAVSAGEFPDDDSDGWCETPFCDKLDLCPKIACEQLGIPVERCTDPNNEDSDGDGIGDPCDTPGRRPGGGSGGGGGGSPGCKSKTEFNAQFHQNVGWSCITEADCEATARKLNLNENEYMCTITESKQQGAFVVNTCECSKVAGYSAPPTYFGMPGQAEVSQPSQAEQQRPVQVAPRTQEALQPPVQRTFEPPVNQQESPVAGIVLLVLVALAIGLLYTWYRRR